MGTTRAFGPFVAGVAAGSLVRRAALRTGVTDDEARAPRPGDDLVHHPMVEMNRGLTIRAPARRIWPWLVQMGYHRGGWYGPEWVDRYVWRVDNPSVDRILPEHQDLSVGDIVPDGPDYAAYFRVAEIHPHRAIVYWSIRHPYRGHPVEASDPAALDAIEKQLLAGGVYIEFSWMFAIDERPDGTSRLMVRTRANYSPRWLTLIGPALGLTDAYITMSMLGRIRRMVENDGTHPARSVPTRESQSAITR